MRMQGGDLHVACVALACAVLAGLGVWSGVSVVAFPAGRSQPQGPLDGAGDFDFEFGTWRTQLSRLQKPLTGSTNWVEYTGTTSVRRVWDGKANLVELDVTGPAGRIQALSLRLFNPEARQWTLNFSNLTSGTLSPPVAGEFKNGRGVFYGGDTLYGRTILVRFVITPTTPDSIRFEQAFSDDGGATWEVNWIAVDTRTKG